MRCRCASTSCVVVAASTIGHSGPGRHGAQVVEPFRACAVQTRPDGVDLKSGHARPHGVVLWIEAMPPRRRQKRPDQRRQTEAEDALQVTLACTQFHHSMEGRDLVRAATLEEYRKKPDFAQGEHPHESEGSLYPGFKYEGYAWGMAIDLNACIGCNACVVACQAENNIPVVGKEQVRRGREMHWLRIDRYLQRRARATPRPITSRCPACTARTRPASRSARCEATVHDAEGLNDMVYNRCVGTRYCSNNCPYKVRRFNFFQYSDIRHPSLKLLAQSRTSRCAAAASWKNAPTACSASTPRGSRRRKNNRPIRDGEIAPPASRPARRKPSSLATSTIRTARSPSSRPTPLNYGLLDRTEHPAAHHLPGQAAQPQPGAGVIVAAARTDGKPMPFNQVCRYRCERIP